MIGYGFSDSYSKAIPFGADAIDYMAILSHRLDGANYSYGLEIVDHDGATQLLRLDPHKKMNAGYIHDGGGAYYTFVPHYFGSTIIMGDAYSGLAGDKLASINLVRFQYQGGGHDDDSSSSVGALSVGKSFTMPQSPDMSITVTREFDSIENKQNMAGKSYSIVYNNGATFGHGEQPFSTYEPNVQGDSGPFTQNSMFKRPGRRIWDLSFSQIAADDMFHAYESPNYSSHSILTDDDITDGGVAIENWGGINERPIPILYDNPIMAIWTMNHGGRLPFIWQPDSDDWTPNGFALCKLDSNSFSVVQESFGRYSCELSIREIF